MTWYFDPYGTQMDVYDHTGDLVASGVQQNGWQEDADGYVVQPPRQVYQVMRDQMKGNQPSAYNRSLWG